MERGAAIRGCCCCCCGCCGVEDADAGCTGDAALSGIMGRGNAETLGACCALGEGLLMLQVWYFLFRSAGLDLLEPGCAAIEIETFVLYMCSELVG